MKNWNWLEKATPDIQPANHMLEPGLSQSTNPGSFIYITKDINTGRDLVSVYSAVHCADEV